MASSWRWNNGINWPFPVFSWHLNFGQKNKFWPKIQNIDKKEILVRKWYFEISKCRITILVYHQIYKTHLDSIYCIWFGAWRYSMSLRFSNCELLKCVFPFIIFYCNLKFRIQFSVPNLTLGTEDYVLYPTNGVLKCHCIFSK